MTTYVVRDGDNLTSIAKRYSTTVQALVQERRFSRVQKNRDLTELC